MKGNTDGRKGFIQTREAKLGREGLSVPPTLQTQGHSSHLGPFGEFLSFHGLYGLPTGEDGDWGGW